MIPELMTPPEVATYMAKAAQAKRLSLNLSQKSLSERSGVSFGTLSKFERTGKISMESLLKLALVLDSLKDFMGVFKPKRPEEFLTLDDLLKQKNRQRGRR